MKNLTKKLITTTTIALGLITTLSVLPTDLNSGELNQPTKAVQTEQTSKAHITSATFGQVTHHTYNGEQFVLVSAEADRDFYQIYTLEEAENFKNESYVTIAFLSNGKTEINLQHLSDENKTFNYSQKQAEANFNFFIASQTFNDTSSDIKL